MVYDMTERAILEAVARADLFLFKYGHDMILLAEMIALAIAKAVFVRRRDAR